MYYPTLFFDFEKEVLVCFRCKTIVPFNEVSVYQCPGCYELHYFCQTCQRVHRVPTWQYVKIHANETIMQFGAIIEPVSMVQSV